MNNANRTLTKREKSELQDARIPSCNGLLLLYHRVVPLAFEQNELPMTAEIEDPYPTIKMLDEFYQLFSATFIFTFSCPSWVSRNPQDHANANGLVVNRTRASENMIEMLMLKC